ncbi:hypothetical protein [Nitrososphaeria virus YSH_462411]|uniref:Uncharacterized protein n=1 Tax=Nitrososphaeria virus YSH_462411 TaxID=3071321 RepID=A0A976UAI8_9CAUD|nr:hypothetical protein QKV92_gp51 [Yangshan Harbor Nitrososphaeria virus]UVF62323.1 hypothetical protein [Nitrososphaeria virus YSH_462411]
MHKCDKCGYESVDPMVILGRYPLTWFCSKCNHKHEVFRNVTLLQESK